MGGAKGERAGEKERARKREGREREKRREEKRRERGRERPGIWQRNVRTSQCFRFLLLKR